VTFRNKDIPNSLVFKYSKDSHNSHVVYRPKVEVRLSNGQESITLVMLVDSGADMSLIPSYIADILNLKITEKRTSESASEKFETGVSEVHIELKKGNRRIKLGKMPILVTLDADKNLNTNLLLGRNNFFKKFDIVFRENTLKILLKKPKNS